MSDQMMALLSQVAGQSDIQNILKGNLDEKSLAPLLKLAEQQGIKITPNQLKEVIKTYNQVNKSSLFAKIKKMLGLS